jgi:uncharacterized protein (TIGR00725 family)
MADIDLGLKQRKTIAVCCAAEPTEREIALAYEVGRRIALQGAILVCGGLGGSMEAACRGAKEAGGITVGILPTYEKSTANPWIDIPIPTGLGHARNNLIAAMGDAIIGVGGSWGTLSELSTAMRMGKRVVVLEGWQVSTPSEIQEFTVARTPEEAVNMVMA